MRNLFISMLVILIFATLIPAIIVMMSVGQYGEDQPDDEKTVSVYFSEEDKTEDISVGAYLKGVLAAEMPAAFEQEALKAQAVAARTYLYSRLAATEEKGAAEEHKGAAVCTDYKHCQAWISKEKRMESWQEDQRKEYWNKIERAVDETKGQILTYEGKPISAVFFSTSAGKTENAVDVWGTETPYLVSVDSPGEEGAPNFTSEKTVSEEEFKEIARANLEGTDDTQELLGEIQKSEAGGVISARLMGVSVKGTTIRTMYDLRSTNFEAEQKDGTVTFRVKGNGHGVGMSQYGAQAMAQKGADYQEILTHYYTGVQLGA